MKKKPTNQEIQDTEGIEGISAKPGNSMALTIDWEAYAHYLDDSDLLEDQKREFLETLLSIMVSWVDLGFELHPLQQVCREDLQNGKSPKRGGKDVIKSRKQLSQRTFAKAADCPKGVPAERTES